MNFDLCNRPLKIQEFTDTLTPKVGVSFGSVGVHSLTLPNTPKNTKCDSQVSFLANTFANPCLSCEPKARVMT
jgi:hypothetical protein